MGKPVTLDLLQPGEQGKIVDVFSGNQLFRRLLDIGFTKNTDVACLYRSPAGDPTAFWIRGTVFALRQEDAERILVRRA